MLVKSTMLIFEVRNWLCYLYISACLICYLRCLQYSKESGMAYL